MANLSLSLRRGVAATLSAAVLLPALAVAPAQASDTQDAYYERTRECINLMFSDPERHAEECGPINSPGGPISSLGGTGPAKKALICTIKKRGHYGPRPTEVALSLNSYHKKHKKFVFKEVLWSERNEYKRFPWKFCFKKKKRGGGYGYGQD